MEQNYTEIILKKICKHKDILNYINLYDKSIEVDDIYSFILEKKSEKHSLEEISKLNFRWLLIDYLRVFKSSNRKHELHSIIIPLIRGEFKIYSDLGIDILAYKIDRNYKKYLNLCKFERGNGYLNSKKLNNYFNIILDSIGISEDEFYSIVKSKSIEYDKVSKECIYIEELDYDKGDELNEQK